MANQKHVTAFLKGGDEWKSFARSGEEDLRGANLRGASISDRTIQFLDLTGADLVGARFENTHFERVSLHGANLSQAQVIASNFDVVDFTRANLGDATFFSTRIQYGTLYEATASASFDWTVFAAVELDGTDFRDARFGNCVFGGLDVRRASNLDSAAHYRPSTIGVDTILASGGRIPEKFLRGCGVPDQVIAYVQSLAQSVNPIELYSCFISHSSRDQEFCQRLHNDLQAAGVRCWFAPEDLKIGDPFRDEIESAIRLHDKLLLVLSEHSVNSAWVQTEVESALEREHRQAARVLFPVRLDDSILEAPKAWAADVRRQRQIGDFTDWRDYDRYKRAFDRLLRDLRAKPANP